MEGAGALLIKKCVNNKFKESKNKGIPMGVQSLAMLGGGMASLSELFKS